MSRLQQLPIALQRGLDQRTILKVIAGLMNFDAIGVERVARAAGRGGADLIDVACDAELVKLAVEASGGLPVCVSSVLGRRRWFCSARAQTCTPMLSLGLRVDLARLASDGSPALFRGCM